MSLEKTAWTAGRLEERLLQLPDTQFTWSRLSELRADFGTRRKAAVLIPLVVKGGEIYVWLTLRSPHLRREADTVALPGGIKDVTDKDETETCLREASEEIGLPRHLVTIIKTLPFTINRAGILVTPVVGIVCETFRPVPDPEEVAAVFMLPFSRFLSDANHHATALEAHSPGWISHLHFFRDQVDGKDYLTWGLTAHFCIMLACFVYNRVPDYNDRTFSSSEPAAMVENWEQYLKTAMNLKASKL